MPSAVDLIGLEPWQFAAVIALFLPGFVSLKVDRLIHPNRERRAAESLIEILGYSLLNAGILGWAILLAAKVLAAARPEYIALSGLALLVCVAGPVAWPLAFRAIQRFLASRGLVMSPHRTAWDDFFSHKEACWVVIHLSDGSSVGGYFGRKSIASVGSETGHLYVQELWQLGPSGEFLKPVPETKGAIFRPSDYLWIEMRKDD